jgi:hypothetical protein
MNGASGESNWVSADIYQLSSCAFYYFFAPAASSLRITPW